MKLQKRKEEDYRQKSKRPEGTKHISLERMARGTVEDSSSILFKVVFSRKTRELKYNPPKTDEGLSEEDYMFQKKKCLLFRKEDALPRTYKKPNDRITVRCIYHGNKNALFPYAVYDMNWNLLWMEKE